MCKDALDSLVQGHFVALREDLKSLLAFNE